MPNTLIHIALQAPAARAAYAGIEIPWILLSVVIPDIPWIFQRIAWMTDIGDPFQIRLYCTLQASLFFSLLLALAFASFARKVLPVFVILAVGSLLHLLIDALQIKWGNGVHLLIPLSYEPTRLGVVWPEHLLGYVLTILGMCYLLFTFKTMIREGIALRKRPVWSMFVVGLALYLLLPLFLMAPLERSNTNFLETVGNPSLRSGRPIEIDRSFYDAKEQVITLFTGESVAVEGVLPPESAVISLKGEFTSPAVIRGHSLHVHHQAYREYASIAGLAATAGIWLYLLLTAPFHSRSRKDQ